MTQPKTQSWRKCRFANSDNCSVVQIRNGCVFVFNQEIYNITNPDINHVEGYARFFYKGEYYSLNQAGVLENEVTFPLNITYEILNAFKELDKQLSDQIDGMFSKK